jgi:hypothetical protein
VLTRQIDELERSEPCGNGFCHEFATYHGETAAYNDERHEAGAADGEVE